MSTRHMSTNALRVLVASLVVAAIAAVAAVTASAATGGNSPAGGDADAHSGDPIAYAPVAGSEGGSAPTRADAKLLSADVSREALGARLAKALGGTGGIEAVTFTSDDKKSALSVRMSENDDSVTHNWYAELAVGVAAQLSATTQTSLDQVIASATAIGPDADGVARSTDLGVGAVALNQVFNSPSDDVLTSRVDEVAQQFGLKVDSAQVLHPLESALSATFVVPHHAKINWTADQLTTALVGATPDVEGVLWQLDDVDGTPLIQASAAYRTGAGSLWFAPGQDTRFGAVHGTFAGAN